MKEFQSWKLEEETKCKSFYVQRSSTQMQGANKHWYFYCNRSGTVRIKNELKRQVKSQGSCKTGKCCIAHMKVVEDTITGTIKVHYCSTHNTHSIEIAHLPIPPSVKSKIASKLHDGVDIEKILDDVRDDTLSTGIGREQLLSRQDIQNILRHLDLGSVTKHKNDHTSTCAWVEELQQQAYNPVLIFKPQGAEQPDNIDNLSKDDFLLGLQTEFQRDDMQRYGNSVIMMDATHGTTQYDFLLISILVLDEFGAGLPVASAISNREDSTLLTEFLKAVHKRVGDLTPTCFMSDCAEQYYNSWCGVFGSNMTKKLLCIWHIDRAWRKSLQEHIPDQQKRIEVYHQLRLERN